MLSTFQIIFSQKAGSLLYNFTLKACGFQSMDGHAANALKDDFMFFKNYSHIILAKFYNYAIILIDYSNVDS